MLIIPKLAMLLLIASTWTVLSTAASREDRSRPISTKFNLGDSVQTTKDLNMRRGPGTTYSIITTISSGNIGQIVDNEDNGISADGYFWWRVQFGNNNGWCVENWLESTKVDTSDWKIYRNEEYGFEIKYPKDFVVETDTIPAVIRRVIAKFRLVNDRYYRKNNLVEASVVISVAKDKEALSNCLQGEAMSVYKGQTLSEEREINGITFYKDSVCEGAAGHQYEKTSYRAIYNNVCCEIALFIHSINMGVFDPGTVSEFNKDEVVEKLNQVISTFRLLR